MKSIILAAGYATRLYPLTRNFPKPLLDIGGTTILGRLLADIDTIDDVDEHIVVTNHKFFPLFKAWADKQQLRHPVTVIDDGTETNETRLGAVGDLLLAIDSRQIDTDIMVLAADNILDFSLAEFYHAFARRDASMVMCHHEPEIAKLQRTGVIEVTDDMHITLMQEKPAEPVSHWAVPPFYIYHRRDLDLIRQCLDNGCGKDAPGSLARYLVDRTALYAWPMSAPRFDIGSLDTYEQAKIKYGHPTETILVTGAAGFIGSNLCRRLLDEKPEARVVGIDNMNDYYDPAIKEWRLEQLVDQRFTFIRGNIADKALVDRIFADYRPDIVVNLAAQAGVRYSITNPDAYIESNLIGFYNILEACRHSYDDGSDGVKHLVYASSSSVYGSNKKVPYSTDDKVDNPVSLYAATKKSNELMAHAYSKLYNIPSTGLRFFTVYGPAGRPDMAYFGFTDKLIKGQKIQIFNYGNCKRDFTYIDDIVEGVMRVMEKAPERRNGDDGLPVPPYAVYNIGNSQPENLLDFVQILQEELVSAGVLPADYDFEDHKELVPMQPGDVPVTYADTSALERDFGFKPSTSLRDGLRAFARWYKDFYRQK